MRETLSVLKTYSILTAPCYQRIEEFWNWTKALGQSCSRDTDTRRACPGSLGDAGFKDKPLEHSYVLFVMLYFLTGMLCILKAAY